MNVILEAFLNTFWLTTAVALVVWAVLRWTPRINAATRGAVWWAVLTFVLLSPAVRMIRLRTPAPAARAAVVRVESALAAAVAAQRCAARETGHGACGSVARASRCVAGVLPRALVRHLLRATRASRRQLPPLAPPEAQRDPRARGTARHTRFVAARLRRPAPRPTAGIQRHSGARRRRLPAPGRPPARDADRRTHARRIGSRTASRTGPPRAPRRLDQPAHPPRVGDLRSASGSRLRSPPD